MAGKMNERMVTVAFRVESEFPDWLPSSAQLSVDLADVLLAPGHWGALSEKYRVAGIQPVNETVEQ